MSSTEKSYQALLDLNNDPFGHVIAMDQNLRNTPLTGSFEVVLPGQPVSTVEVSHVATPKNPSHMYQFNVTKPEFEALPGVPVNVYDLCVNTDTSEAVLFVARKIVAVDVSVEMTQFYDAVHNMGMNLPNEADLEEFAQVFGRFCSHLAEQGA